MPTEHKRLTDAVVAALPLPILPAGEPASRLGVYVVDVFDTEQDGLYVRLSPAGSRVFYLRYWSRTLRKARRIRLGAFPDLSVKQARALARKHAGEVASDSDPLTTRDAKREAVLQAQRDAAAALTIDGLMAMYLAHAAGRIRPSTAGLYRTLHRVHITEPLGALRVDAVTVSDVAALHRRMIETKTAANQVRRLLSTLYRFAEKQHLVPRGTNPAADVEPYPERDAERYLRAEELAAVLRALDRAERDGLPPAPVRQQLHDARNARRRTGGATKAKHRPKSAGAPEPANPTAVAALRLLILTGARKQEVLRLRWREVDLVQGLLQLDDTKTGASVRPLSPEAIAVLTAQPRVVGSPWVFPSPRDARKPLSDITPLWYAVCHAAGLSGVRVHDLRHTAASLMLQAGATLPEVGRAIGHSSARATERYAKMDDRGAKSAATKLGAVVAAAAAQGSATVTPIAKKSKVRRMG
jgi:integrase